MLQLGEFRLDVISDGFFEDSADSFVGLSSPKQGHVRARMKPRIKVGFNSLLVRGAGQTVLIDPGTGDKPRDAERQHYHLEWPRKVLPELEALGVRKTDVDAVILTHLHWDHCGACSSVDEAGNLASTFPQAVHFVQERELFAARRSKEGYSAADFEPLAQGGVLKTLTGDGEILPGFSVRWTGGHSAGHQVVYVESQGERAVYLSDCVPTSAQLSPNHYLSYDEDAAQLKSAKQAILRESWERNDLLIFVHAPKIRAGYLNLDNQNKYRLQSCEI